MRTSGSVSVSVRDGSAIRGRRQRLGLSQRDLAFLCRPCSQTTIYLLETGRMRSLTLDLALRVAKRLDVEPADLFDEQRAAALRG